MFQLEEHVKWFAVDVKPPGRAFSQFFSCIHFQSAVAERSSFLVNVGDLIQKISTPEDIGKRVSQGLAVTCWVDTASGTLGFRLNDRDTLTRFQVSNPMCSIVSNLQMVPQHA